MRVKNRVQQTSLITDDNELRFTTMLNEVLKARGDTVISVTYHHTTTLDTACDPAQLINTYSALVIYQEK